MFTAGGYHFAALTLGGPGIGMIAAIDFTSSSMPTWGSTFHGGVACSFLAVIYVVIFGVQVSVRTQLSIIGLSLIPFIILIVAVLAVAVGTASPSMVVQPVERCYGGLGLQGVALRHPDVRRLPSCWCW